MPAQLPPAPPAGQIALFLDFDGTLVGFADHPGDVRVPAELLALLDQLQRQTQGALAIVTGREIYEIDAFLKPLVLPVAGVHGLTRRDANGRVHRSPVRKNAVEKIVNSLDQFTDDREGLLIERKSASVALHYRLAPMLAAECQAAMEEAVSLVAGFQLQYGKHVIEARCGDSDKGTAIQAFLDQPPFSDRLPVFAGDDVTDEDGFRVLHALAGPSALTIKVGPGDSCARYRVTSIEALADWLRSMAGNG